MSIARLVFPSRLELKSFAGSFSDAPLKNVSFTTDLYDSPVQMPPSCDHTGVPIHFHSSTTSGSASVMSARILPSVSPLQSPSSAILSLISLDAATPIAFCWLFIVRFCLGIGNVVQSMRGPLRHLVRYGSTNKYRPVKRSKKSGGSGK